MYKIAICDDIKSHIEGLKKLILLSGFKKGNTVFYEFMSGEEFIANIKGNHMGYDLLILDMQMGEMNGFETARIFRQYFPNSVLVFCSGVEGIQEGMLEVEPFRYLLKRHSDEVTIKTLKQIYEKVAEDKKELCIHGKCNGNEINLPIKKISYIEKEKRGCRIHLFNENGKDKLEWKFTTEKHLDVIFEELKKLGFARPHNSYIINIKHLDITKMTKNQLTLNDGTVLAISRSWGKPFKSEVGLFLSNKY